MKRHKKIVFSIFILLVLSLGIIYLIFFNNYRKQDEEIYARFSSRLESESEAIINLYHKWAVQIWESQINREPVLKLLQKAYNSADEKEKEHYRRELYDYLSPLYGNLIIHNFRQLHFHTRENVSFLRMHRPMTYGDDLTDIRFSVKSVNENRTALSGFEEGRIFNGIRNVFPLEYKGENLGSVEISFSMSLLISKLEEQFYSEAEFIILRSVVESKVFEDEKSNYIPWHANSDFFLDRGISDVCVIESDISDRDREEIRTVISRELENNSDHFSMHLTGGEGIILSFKAVRSFDGDIVAFIFTKNGDEDMVELQRYFFFITMSFSLLLLLLFYFIYYYNQSESKLELMLIHDQLTGAFSRRIILEKLKYELNRFRRYGSPFCIAMIDIDHFKKVNDDFGHLTGDAVLKELSSLVMRKIRNTDIFGRYGGEEFLLILPETKKNEARTVLENIRKEVGNYDFPIAGRVTISSGLSCVNDNSDDINNLIEAADGNLYRAKEAGRNRVVP